VTAEGQVAWSDGSGRAFSAKYAGGYVTLRDVRGGGKRTVVVSAGS
jgi:hypothetical protein